MAQGTLISRLPDGQPHSRPVLRHPIRTTEERSYGVPEDTGPVAVQQIQLLSPEDETKCPSSWSRTIGVLLSEGCRIGYSDGTGSRVLLSQEIVGQALRSLSRAPGLRGRFGTLRNIHRSKGNSGYAVHSYRLSRRTTLSHDYKPRSVPHSVFWPRSRRLAS